MWRHSRRRRPGHTFETRAHPGDGQAAVQARSNRARARAGYRRAPLCARWPARRRSRSATRTVSSRCGPPPRRTRMGSRARRCPPPPSPPWGTGRWRRRSRRPETTRRPSTRARALFVLEKYVLPTFEVAVAVESPSVFEAWTRSEGRSPRRTRTARASRGRRTSRCGKEFRRRRRRREMPMFADMMMIEDEPLPNAEERGGACWIRHVPSAETFPLDGAGRVGRRRRDEVRARPLGRVPGGGLRLGRVGRAARARFSSRRPLRSSARRDATGTTR